MKKIKFKIKKNDLVKVIAGKDKNKVGVVKFILTKDSMVVVEGVNIIKRAIKQQQDGQNFLKIEKPIHISNVKKIEEKQSVKKSKNGLK